MIEFFFIVILLIGAAKIVGKLAAHPKTTKTVAEAVVNKFLK